MNDALSYFSHCSLPSTFVGQTTSNALLLLLKSKENLNKKHHNHSRNVLQPKNCLLYFAKNLKHSKKFCKTKNHKQVPLKHANSQTT